MRRNERGRQPPPAYRGRVGDAGGGEAVAADAAGVAATAGGAVRGGVVAAVRQGEIDAEGPAEADDFRLGLVDERRVDVESPFVLDAGPGGEVGQLLEGAGELRPAIRISGVIDGVDSDIQVEGAKRLGPGQGQRQENGVAGRDVGDGDAGRHLFGGAVARHVDVGGEGGAAEGAEVEGEDAVFGGAQGVGDAAGGVEFDGVPLAVGHGEGVAAEAVVAGRGQGHGGIEAAAEQDDGRTRRIGHGLPLLQCAGPSPRHY